jgi:hypothetical protein
MWGGYVDQQERLTWSSSRKLAFCYHTLDVSGIRKSEADQLTDLSRSAGCTGDSQRPDVSILRVLY